MLTAKIENLIVTVNDLKAIHNDTRIQKSSLAVRTGTLWIANNAHAGITDQHQMLAKGIVYHIDSKGGFTLVSMPFPKFYNSFEGVCLDDMKDLQYDGTEVVKKQDGSLISRFVWDNVVYFATRGNILTPEKLFYNPVMKLVLVNHTGMEQVGHFDYEGMTYLMEYVGPSNVILEPYDKDELIYIGITCFNIKYGTNDWEVRSYSSGDYPGIPEEWNVRSTPVFNETDPQTALDSMEGIQEGVIVNYLKDGLVVYRTKFKHEDYIKALKSRSFVAKIDPVAELLDVFGDFDPVQSILDKYAVELKDNPYQEELLKVIEDSLRGPEVLEKLKRLLEIESDVFVYANELKYKAETGTDRRHIFEEARDSALSSYKGLIIKMVYGDVYLVDRMKAIYKITG